MEKSYVISETLLNATLVFLSNQPYRNVAPLVTALSQLSEFVPSQATALTGTNPTPLKAVNEA